MCACNGVCASTRHLKEKRMWEWINHKVVYDCSWNSDHKIISFSLHKMETMYYVKTGPIRIQEQQNLMSSTGKSVHVNSKNNIINQLIYKKCDLSKDLALDRL